MKHPVFIAVCGIVAAAAGFGSGNIMFAPRDEGPAQDENKEAIRSLGKSSRTDGAGPVIPPMQPEILGELMALKGAFDEGNLKGFLENLKAIEDKSMRFQIMLEVADKLTSDQFEKLFTYMIENEDELEDVFDDEEVFILLIEPWVKKDPDGPINFGLDQDDDGMMFAVIGLAFYAAQDYDAAVAKLQEIKPIIKEKMGDEMGVEGEEFANQIMLFGLSLNSPADALRRIREEGLDADMSDEIFALTTQVDGEVLDEIIQFEDQDQRQDLAEEFFDVWSRRDPVAALDGIQKYIDETGLTGEEALEALEAVQDEIFGNWARTDPREALKYLDRIEDKPTRDSALMDIAQGIAATDPEEALAMVKEQLEDFYQPRMLGWKIDPALKRRILDDITGADGQIPADLVMQDNRSGNLVRLIQSDPQATTEWLIPKIDQIPANPDGKIDYQNFTGQQAGNALAGSDLEAAVAMLGQIPPGKFREGFVDGLVARGAGIDPLRTAEVVNSMGGETTPAMNSTLVNSWLKHQPEAAVQYAANLGESHLDKALHNWARRDAAGALNWLTETGNPAAANFVSDPDIHRQWIEQDAWAGADVAASLPVPQATEATAVYVTQWARIAPTEASAYIKDSMQAGPVRDAAIVSLAASIAPDDPVSAREWVNAIADPDMRAEALAALP